MWSWKYNHISTLLYYYSPILPVSSLGLCSPRQNLLGLEFVLANEMWVRNGNAAWSASLKAVLSFCPSSALCHDNSIPDRNHSWVGKMSGGRERAQQHQSPQQPEMRNKLLFFHDLRLQRGGVLATATDSYSFLSNIGKILHWACLKETSLSGFCLEFSTVIWIPCVPHHCVNY